VPGRGSIRRPRPAPSSRRGRPNFYVRTVVSQPPIGGQIAIACDSGTLHVAYYDAGNMALRYGSGNAFTGGGVTQLALPLELGTMAIDGTIHSRGFQHPFASIRGSTLLIISRRSRPPIPLASLRPRAFALCGLLAGHRREGIIELWRQHWPSEPLHGLAGAVRVALPEVVAGEAGRGGGEGVGQAGGGAVVEGGGVALVRGEELRVGEAGRQEGRQPAAAASATARPKNSWWAVETMQPAQDSPHCSPRIVASPYKRPSILAGPW